MPIQLKVRCTRQFARAPSTRCAATPAAAAAAASPHLGLAPICCPQVQGDPRRPAEVRPFHRPKLNMDEVGRVPGHCSLTSGKSQREVHARRLALHHLWRAGAQRHVCGPRAGTAAAFEHSCLTACLAQMPPDMFLICGLALGLISLVFKVGAVRLLGCGPARIGSCLQGTARLGAC